MLACAVLMFLFFNGKRYFEYFGYRMVYIICVSVPLYFSVFYRNNGQ